MICGARHGNCAAPPCSVHVGVALITINSIPLFQQQSRAECVYTVYRMRAAVFACAIVHSTMCLPRTCASNLHAHAMCMTMVVCASQINYLPAICSQTGGGEARARC